jgi:hypothetical protein
MSRRRTTPVWRALVVGSTLVVLSGTLAGCSGRGAAAEALASGPVAAEPSGPCDKAGFAAHAGLASGAVRLYVWRPFTAGELSAGAKRRGAAIATAAGASKLTAAELAAAQPLVVGCPDGTRLLNALGTGRSLSTAAANQLAASKINTETLAGMNSIMTTVLGEATSLGIPVTEVEPTAKQLTG